MKRSLSVAPETVRGMMALVVIAERLSFAAAADELGITASAVSKLVSRMEERLGTRLVHRTTRRVQLTEAGLLYCERAHRVLEELDASERELEQLDPEPKGTLRITAPNVLGHLRVVPVVLAFQRQYRQVRVICDMTDAVIDLVAERIDLAVRTTPDPPESMVARKIDDDVRFLCATPSYLAERGTPETLADLTHHDCLPARINGRVVPWRFTAPDDSTRNYLTHEAGWLQFNNMMSIREAALAGMGIAELPLFLTSHDLERGRLVRVLQSFPRVQRAIYVIYTPSPFLPAKVRLLVEALRKSARECPPGASDLETEPLQSTGGG